MRAAKRQRREVIPCVYCGRDAGNSFDHIPPRCLFPQGFRENLITVPSCVSCNRGFSSDDEYFRDCIVMKHEVGDNPQAKLVQESMLRSFARPQKRKKFHALMNSTRKVNLVSSGGVWLKEGLSYSADLTRLCATARRIIRGLYFHRFQRRFPDDHQVSAWEDSGMEGIDSETGEKVANICRKLIAREGQSRGDGVFDYWMEVASDNPDATVWLLRFYGSLPFLGVTLPESAIRREQDARSELLDS